MKVFLLTKIVDFSIERLDLNDTLAFLKNCLLILLQHVQ